MHVPARRGRPKTNARPQGFDLSPPLPEGSSRRLNLSNTGNKKRTVTRIQNRAARELLRELLISALARQIIASLNFPTQEYHSCESARRQRQIERVALVLVL